jgi:hypothetical protein
MFTHELSLYHPTALVVEGRYPGEQQPLSTASPVTGGDTHVSGSVTFRASCFECMISPDYMHRRKSTHAETPIERIFREVMGRKMPPPIRRILLPKRMAKRKSR